MGINIIKFDGIKGIIKCNHIEKENAIKLLTSITNIDHVKIEIITLGTSGTIKSLIKKHMKIAILF
jgi:RNase P/RNase MRP subunit POP5